MRVLYDSSSLKPLSISAPTPPSLIRKTFGGYGCGNHFRSTCRLVTCGVISCIGTPDRRVATSAPAGGGRYGCQSPGRPSALRQRGDRRVRAGVRRAARHGAGFFAPAATRRRGGTAARHRPGGPFRPGDVLALVHHAALQGQIRPDAARRPQVVRLAAAVQQKRRERLVRGELLGVRRDVAAQDGRDLARRLEVGCVDLDQQLILQRAKVGRLVDPGAQRRAARRRDGEDALVRAAPSARPPRHERARRPPSAPAPGRAAAAARARSWRPRRRIASQGRSRWRCCQAEHSAGHNASDID